MSRLSTMVRKSENIPSWKKTKLTFAVNHFINEIYLYYLPHANNHQKLLLI